MHTSHDLPILPCPAPQAPYVLSLTLVLCFNPVKVPTTLVLLNFSSWQLDVQDASTSVKVYCTATKGAPGHRQQDQVALTVWLQEPCHARCCLLATAHFWRGEGSNPTLTNALFGSGSAVAVPLLKLVALAEVRLSAGGVVSLLPLGYETSVPLASTQITVTL